MLYPQMSQKGADICGLSASSADAAGFLEMLPETGQDNEQDQIPESDPFPGPFIVVIDLNRV